MDSPLRQPTIKQLATLLLALGLVGCAGSPATDQPPAGGASPETTDFPPSPAAPATPIGSPTPAPTEGITPADTDEPDGDAGAPAGDLPMGRLVFDSDRGDSVDIWLLEEGSAEPRQLTTDDAVDRVPTISPDGATILFASDRIRGPDSPSGLRTYALYSIGVEGGEPEHLLGSRTFTHHGVFSPDMSQIAFYSDPTGEHQVYVMNADGSGSPPALTDDPVQAESPAWSPDGSQIVFSSLRDSEDCTAGNGRTTCTTYNREIYVMDADGSNETRLTDNPATDGSPDWSPDGTQIVFSSDRSGNSDIYVMNADGSDVSQLTDDPADDRFPSWSPDGSMIAFDSDRDDNLDIYVMSADGGGQINVTSHPARDGFPDWGSADGAAPSDGDGGATTQPTGAGQADVVEASWAMGAGAELGDPGERVTYRCPAGGQLHAVWGTDVYTDDSSVCSAAVHAGLITADAGGDVTIEIAPGQDSYEASQRNGVQSLDYGPWERSFTFVDD